MGTAELGERIAAVRQRIANACQRCGRDPSTVTLVAVTKGVSAAVIQEAVACGLAQLGENRIQEARRKRETMGVRSAEWGVRSSADSEFRTPNSELPSDLSAVKWHLIGHLQRNKAKDAVAMFDVIHSVDTHTLAEEIERQAAKQGRSVEVFVQVNVSGETSKFGCAPDEVQELTDTIRQLGHLRFTGLMTIAPFSDDPERSRPHFHQLRSLRDDLASTLHLSMGMSQDFEVAIEEGADVVRIGTAIFGATP